MSLPVSIGIAAHNEEKNIGKLLPQLFSQKLKTVKIREIIIISSGSTDKTNQIIKDFAQKNKLISFIPQKKRLGKAAAVNLFLSKARGKIVILMSADILLKEDTIENLVSPLKDPKVGIVGCRPTPINDPHTFMGFAVHLLWDLHHQISLKNPKMGEMIAFRRIFQRIPVLSSVDEANIESLIRGQGYKAVYTPEAVIYNKGPETISEFIARRRHIYAGHFATKYEYSYEVATFSGLKIFFLLLKNIKLSWRFFLWTPLVVMLEVASRFLGFLDYKLGLKKHTVWQMIPSTKDLGKVQILI